MEACWAHNPEVRGSKPRSAIRFSIKCFLVTFDQPDKSKKKFQLNSASTYAISSQNIFFQFSQFGPDRNARFKGYIRVRLKEKRQFRTRQDSNLESSDP